MHPIANKPEEIEAYLALSNNIEEFEKWKESVPDDKVFHLGNGSALLGEPFGTRSGTKSEFTDDELKIFYMTDYCAPKTLITRQGK